MWRGSYHICRKWTSVEGLLLYSLCAMPVPAEVYWTSPRFRVSTLFIESRWLNSPFRMYEKISNSRCYTLVLSNAKVDGGGRKRGKYPMSRKSGRWRNTVLIDDSQWSKLGELWIIVIRKRKGVKRLEPSVIRFASFSGLANLVFQCGRSSHCCGCSN